MKIHPSFSKQVVVTVEGAINAMQSQPEKLELYHPKQLTLSEANRLEKALLSGYGNLSAAQQGATAYPMPVGLGLVTHWYHVGHSRKPGPNDLTREVKKHAKFDSQLRAAMRQKKLGGRVELPRERPRFNRLTVFPLAINMKLLRKYFVEQLARYCMSQRLNTIGALTREYLTLHHHYEKPWYEYHGWALIKKIEAARRSSAKRGGPKYLVSRSSNWSASLGRLAEQYFWRFNFELTAQRGKAVAQRASDGGKQRAKEHRKLKSDWQKAAAAVWSRQPSMSKSGVARHVKSTTRARVSAKHIARYINRP